MKTTTFTILCVLFLCLVGAGVVRAQSSDAFRSTDYPLPRFASMAAGEAFVRAGPGRKFPVKWVLKKKQMPVEIVLEYDAWRKIKDVDGDEGWVHQSLLSGRRTGVVKSDTVVPLYRKPKVDSQVLVNLEPFVVIALEECKQSWCKVNASGYKGWVYKPNIWGVYADEVF